MYKLRMKLLEKGLAFSFIEMFNAGVTVIKWAEIPTFAGRKVKISKDAGRYILIHTDGNDSLESSKIFKDLDEILKEVAELMDEDLKFTAETEEKEPAQEERKTRKTKEEK